MDPIKAKHYSRGEELKKEMSGRREIDLLCWPVFSPFSVIVLLYLFQPMLDRADKPIKK